MSEDQGTSSSGAVRPIDIIMQARAREPSTPREAAIAYAAQQRWAVVPLYGAQLGACTCAAGEKCPLPAAHPSTPRGASDASKESAGVEELWRERSLAGVGLATGSRSNLIALVVGMDKDSQKLLSRYVGRHGQLPETAQIIRPDGRTYLFSYEGGPLLTDTDLIYDTRPDPEEPGKNVMF